MNKLKKIQTHQWGTNPSNIQLVSNLLSRLTGRGFDSDKNIYKSDTTPLIEVVDDKEKQKPLHTLIV